MQQLLNYNGRPCEIVTTGRRRAKNPRWRPVTFSVIRYLDGRVPTTEEVTSGQLAKAQRLRETESIYWLRVDTLRRDGMDIARARDQARAELTKGILAEAVF
jgi:hypothetical protein